jgi:hypothetical protein
METENYKRFLKLFDNTLFDSTNIIKSEIKQNGNMIYFYTTYKCNHYDKFKEAYPKKVEIKENQIGDFLFKEQVDLGNKVLTFYEYDKEKDIVRKTVKTYTYKYSVKKERTFFSVRKSNVFTLTPKDLYVFKLFRTGRKKKRTKQLVQKFSSKYHYLDDLAFLCPVKADDLNRFPAGNMTFTWRDLNKASKKEILEEKFKVKVPNAFLKLQSNDILYFLILFKEKDFSYVINEYKKCIALSENKTLHPRRFFAYLVEKQTNKNLDFNQGTRNLFYDYVDDLITLNKKLNLKINSLKRIEEEHRNNSRIITLNYVKNFKVNPVYEKIFNKFDLPVRELDNKEKLVEEGLFQHHCVATYHNKINVGNSGIYSIDYDNERWTLELSALKEKGKLVKKFQVIQFKGKFNKEAPRELLNKVKDYLNKKKMLFLESEYTPQVIPETADILPF